MRIALHLVIAAASLAVGIAVGWFVWADQRPTTPIVSSAPTDKKLNELQQAMAELQRQMAAIAARPSNSGSSKSIGAGQARIEERLDALARQTDQLLAMQTRLLAAQDAKYQRALHTGNTLFTEKKLDQAIEALNVAVDMRPELFNAYLLRGVVQMERRNWQAAIDDLMAARQLNPQNPDANNNLAWIRATCPDERFRDGAAAIQLASAACEITDWNNAALLSTLAAAYAEEGDFEAALHWQQKCLDLTSEEHRDDFRKVLAQYERKEPLRDEDIAARE
jgi:Flp pilus assembly protein TadD